METTGIRAEGAKIKYQHFVDGSRHSVYYKRNSDETIFFVDQEEIHISSLVIKPPQFQLIPNQNLNVGEIFVGGVNEAVPDLLNFNRFKGCLSSKYGRRFICLLILPPCVIVCMFLFRYLC